MMLGAKIGIPKMKPQRILTPPSSLFISGATRKQRKVVQTNVAVIDNILNKKLIVCIQKINCVNP